MITSILRTVLGVALFLGTVPFLVAQEAPSQQVAKNDLGFNMPDQFSAIQEVRADGQTVKGKLYVDKDKWRIEAAMGGMQAVTIMRKDKQLIYTLLPQIKGYFSTPYSAQADRAMNLWRMENSKWQKLGQEKIRGELCDKYRVTLGTNSCLVWIDEDEKIPRRITTEDMQFAMDMYDLKKGPQPPELFEVPKDYSPTKVTIGTPPSAQATP